MQEKWERLKIKQMFYHDCGVLRIANVVRYIITYDPILIASNEVHRKLEGHAESRSSIADSTHSKENHHHGSSLFLRIRNCAQIIRRAQYLSGPYFLSVSVREAEFNANDEITGEFNTTSPPIYEPELKANSSFWAELEIGNYKYVAVRV